MSLLNFPPPSVQECSYALQEYAYTIRPMTRQEVTAWDRELQMDYPRLERTSLSNLQHSLSRDNVFVVREIDEELGASTEGNDENAGGGCCKAVPRSQSWLRCVAVDEGGCVAVCESTDYIRIYGIGADSQKPPLTLHHAQMKNVAAMQFEPHDARLLAVAAGANVLVWRLSARRFLRTTDIEMEPGQCIRVMETGVSPLSSLVWDSVWGKSVMVASCTTNKIILADLSTGARSSVGAPFEGGVTGLYPSRDGTRLAVTYTTNVLRIYDRATWTDEKREGLAGRATGVVWSPTGESLIYSTEEAATLFALSFSKNMRTGEDGVTAIFDLSPLSFDPLKNATPEMHDHWSLREKMEIGGPVRSMTCSADGERLAVTFARKECCGLIAVFSVVRKPWASSPVTLYPIGFVEAASSGTPECVFFLPQYSTGSLLAISWSSGSVQYVPLIYKRLHLLPKIRERMEHPSTFMNRWEAYVDYGNRW